MPWCVLVAQEEQEPIPQFRAQAFEKSRDASYPYPYP